MNELDKAQHIIFSSGISQYQIHKETEVPQPVISRIKTGKRSIRSMSFETINKLSKYYDHMYK